MITGFMLFGGEAYYAKGGFNDFVGRFMDIESAEAIVAANCESRSSVQWDWWHIIDSETLDVIAQSETQAHGCDENSYCPEKED